MRARVLNRLKIARAARTIEQNPRTVVFVTPLLRAREIKMASALRSIGWIVILLYKQTTPIPPDDNFDITIQASTDEDLHSAANGCGRASVMSFQERSTNCCCVFAETSLAASSST